MLHAVDKPIEAGGQTARQTHKIMTVHMGQLEFMLEQNEVMTFESIPELDTRNKPRYSLGTFSVNGHETPVYCLSDELELIDQIPSDRDTCIVLRKENRTIGLICNEYKALEYIMFNVQNIPDCMAHKKSPISALCVYQLDDGIPAVGKMLSADTIDTYIRLY